MKNLDGKQVLITGASKGLGAALARGFAEQGAHLTLIARDQQLLKNNISELAHVERHTACALDLFESQSITPTIEALVAGSGGFDIVVHCAGGGLGQHETLLTGAALHKSFQLNVAAGVEINRLVVPEMQKKGRGTIIHIGSIASQEAHGSVSYNTVKAALAAYVRSIGRLLISDGIVVTGVMPGGYETEDNSFARLKVRDPAQYREYLETKPPRKMLGAVEELLPLFSFLVSEQNGMMAGCMVPIDGGEGKSYSY